MTEKTHPKGYNYGETLYGSYGNAWIWAYNPNLA